MDDSTPGTVSPLPEDINATDAELTARLGLEQVLIGFSCLDVENQGLHTWRCRYYDAPCEHNAELLDALTEVVTSIVNPVIRARDEAQIAFANDVLRGMQFPDPDTERAVRKGLAMPGSIESDIAALPASEAFRAPAKEADHG
jgi:hypothetical protein